MANRARNVPDRSEVPTLRIGDVRAITRWSDKTIYRRVADGSLPAWRVGRFLRFRESDVLAQLRRVPTAADFD